MKYRTIVADPPWRYGNQNGTPARGHARRHYQTLELDEIKSLPIADLATPDAHLYVWGVNQLIDKAFEVVRAWGFNPITMGTWHKTKIGTGYYLRSNTEHFVFATRGKPMTPEKGILGTCFDWPSKQHSQKPEGFFDLVERLSPGPYLELFARRNRLGWDTWGNESLNHVGEVMPL